MKKTFTLACLTGALLANTLVPTAYAASHKLTLSTFAINEDIIKQDILVPFSEKFDTEFVTEVGNSGERFTKLTNNPNAKIDIIELSQAHATQGQTDGLFEKLDASKVPNIDLLTDSAKEVVETAGVPYTVNSIGIIYDPEALGKDISEWADLWDSSLAGKVSIPDISTTFGPAFLYLASDYKSVDITSDQGKAAFEALSELRPNILKTYSKSSDLSNLFQTGEIQAAVVADFAIPLIIQANPQLKYVVPESGTYANYNTVNVLAKSENKELAYDYVNWKLDQELQVKVAESLNETPTNKEVQLSDDLQANKTYGEIAERAKSIDYSFVDQHLKAWIQEWNQVINQ